MRTYIHALGTYYDENVVSNWFKVSKFQLPLFDCSVRTVDLPFLFWNVLECLQCEYRDVVCLCFCSDVIILMC